jgi:ion channel
MGVLASPVYYFLMTMLIVAAVAVVSRSRVSLTAILVAFAAALAANLFRHESRSVLVNFIFYGAELAFVIVLTSVVGQAVFGHGRVTFHRIQGAIAFYLLIAVIFAYFYLLLVTLVPNAFNQSIVLTDSFGASRLLYFSFATLTTTGYGDIAPVHPLARSLANPEAVIGQLFPATLLARIVTLELAQRRH